MTIAVKFFITYFTIFFHFYHLCYYIIKCSYKSSEQKKIINNFIFTISYLAPHVGLEPTTYRLTAERSTNWANEEYIKSGNNLSFQQGNPQVFSAHLGLTSVFGMETGIALSVIITRKLITYSWYFRIIS